MTNAPRPAFSYQTLRVFPSSSPGGVRNEIQVAVEVEILELHFVSGGTANALMLAEFSSALVLLPRDGIRTARCPDEIEVAVVVHVAGAHTHVAVDMRSDDLFL